MNKPHRNPIEGKPVLVAIDTHTMSFGPLAQLVDTARERGVPVVFADRAATGIAAPADVRAGEYLIRHRRHSVFYGTELAILLRELDARTVILAGGETSIGVHYSFVDAHQHDYFCRAVEDCMQGSSPRAHEAALRAMEYMQTGARKTCEEMVAAFGALREAASFAKWVNS
jgi:nicotinamidase-related amidase